jgi:hypothetical protein
MTIDALKVMEYYGGGERFKNVARGGRSLCAESFMEELHAIDKKLVSKPVEGGARDRSLWMGGRKNKGTRKWKPKPSNSPNTLFNLIYDRNARSADGN